MTLNRTHTASFYPHSFFKPSEWLRESTSNISTVIGPDLPLFGPLQWDLSRLLVAQIAISSKTSHGRASTALTEHLWIALTTNSLTRFNHTLTDPWIEQSLRPLIFNPQAKIILSHEPNELDLNLSDCFE